MTHVLFVAAWWPSEEEPLNGIFIREHALAISNFAKVTVIYIHHLQKSTSWSAFPSKATKEVEQINENLHVVSYNIEFRIRRFGILEWQLTNLISGLIKEFENTTPVDIIHLNILHFLIPNLILKNSERFKKPIVLTEHSTFLHTEIYQLPQEKVIAQKNKFRILLNSPFLRSVMPVSRQLGEVLINDYQTPSEKISIVANIANDCFLGKIINLPVTTDEIVIFAAASWQDSKDPLLFFEMLKHLRKEKNELYFKLCIHWGGAGKYMSSVKSFVDKELTDLKISFLGRIDKTIIAEYMSQSHFLIHPTIAENLPCIIIESLSSGLPVLTGSPIRTL